MTLETKTVHAHDIARCPKKSLLPEHYLNDGSCRCGQREAADRAVFNAEQELKVVRAKLRRARRWLEIC